MEPLSMITAGISAAKGIYDIATRPSNGQQLAQQDALDDIQDKHSQAMMDYQMKSQKALWDSTNTEAQVEHYKAAGMNPALMYGGSGQGGATTGSGMAMAQGAQAATTAQTQQANTDQSQAIAQMGMALSQAALINAQKDNVDADTANKKVTKPNIVADTENKEETNKNLQFNNAVNAAVGVQKTASGTKADINIKETNADEKGTMWGQFVQANFGDNTDNGETVRKSLMAGQNKLIEEVKNCKATGDILRAQKAIEEYKSDLAKAGLTPDTPWYVKIMGSALEKMGLNPLTNLPKK